jgi:hypothetical protein
MSHNPLHSHDREREQRIRERAYHLWEQDGRPHGNDADYWERARELIGMEESPNAGQLPNPMIAHRKTAAGGEPIEEAELEQNLGEFPAFQTDQGDKQQTPSMRRRARAPRAKR